MRGAPEGIRTPNLLIRRRGAAVQRGWERRASRSEGVFRQLAGPHVSGCVAVSVAVISAGRLGSAGQRERGDPGTGAGPAAVEEFGHERLSELVPAVGVLQRNQFVERMPESWPPREAKLAVTLPSGVASPPALEQIGEQGEFLDGDLLTFESEATACLFDHHLQARLRPPGEVGETVGVGHGRDFVPGPAPLVEGTCGFAHAHMKALRQLRETQPPIGAFSISTDLELGLSGWPDRWSSDRYISKSALARERRLATAVALVGPSRKVVR